jgi:hypothetical protein
VRPRPPVATGRDLPELALAVALLAALLALGAAMRGPGADTRREAETRRCYSWPAAPIAFVSLLDRA